MESGRSLDVYGTASSITDCVEALDLVLVGSPPRAKASLRAEFRERNKGTTKDFPGAGEVVELFVSCLDAQKRDTLRTALCPNVVAGSSCGWND